MKLFTILIVVFILITPISATDLEENQKDLFGTDQLESSLNETTQSLMGDIGLDNLDFGTNVLEILINGINQSFSGIKSALSVAVSMMAVVMLSALVTQMESQHSKQAVLLAGVLALTVLSVNSVGTMVDLGKETLAELEGFTTILFPILATATAASGGVATSTVLYAGSVFLTNVILSAMTTFLVPLVYAYLAISAAQALLGNHALKRIQSLMKWCISKGIKWLLWGFSGYLSLSGIVSGVGDTTAIKAVKLTFSAVVPVVGSMISDASETVLVSAAMIRNAIGIFGMLAVIAICILPLLRLVMQYVVLKITAAVSATIGNRQLTDFMESVADAMGFLAGMTGACGFMMLISCVCTVKAVTG
ncbi:MAG: hypothetical protein R3Y62_01755 [Eubacteriales bacterium]